METDHMGSKNVVVLHDQFDWRNHLFGVFEKLSINLYELLKETDFNGLSMELVCRFAIQLLISLMHFKDNQVIHCDLKPENILLRKRAKSGIKVIDFGASCTEGNIIYTYVQS